MATNNSDKVGKTDKWNDDTHATLCGALVMALTASGSSMNSHKELVQGVLQANGYDFTWEAIR
jgi:hypothetical protein